MGDGLWHCLNHINKIPVKPIDESPSKPIDWIRGIEGKLWLLGNGEPIGFTI